MPPQNNQITSMMFKAPIPIQVTETVKVSGTTTAVISGTIVVSGISTVTISGMVATSGTANVTVSGTVITSGTARVAVSGTFPVTIVNSGSLLTQSLFKDVVNSGIIGNPVLYRFNNNPSPLTWAGQTIADGISTNNTAIDLGYAPQVINLTYAYSSGSTVWNRVRGDNNYNMCVTPAGHTFKNITASVLVKNVTATLHAVTVNATTVSGTIIVYDGASTSGNIIASIGTITGQHPYTLHYDVRCPNGIYVLSSGTHDITVSYA